VSHRQHKRRREPQRFHREIRGHHGSARNAPCWVPVLGRFSIYQVGTASRLSLIFCRSEDLTAVAEPQPKTL